VIVAEYRGSLRRRYPPRGQCRAPVPRERDRDAKAMKGDALRRAQKQVWQPKVISKMWHYYVMKGQSGESRLTSAEAPTCNDVIEWRA